MNYMGNNLFKTRPKEWISSIKASPKDIYKTAFITHFGLFEFKVMPFGLTNVSTLFQALMNSVFEPYLRHFVQVFFDDILAYNKSLDKHKQHLKKVLE